jgi:N-acetyl-D-muramate 6-phosphate phosphatase
MRAADPLSGQSPVQAVLFDLDGTLADTAVDLAYAVNLQLQARGQPVLPLAQLRPLVSQGARGMLRAAFGLLPEHAEYGAFRDEFLAFYLENLSRETRLFPGMGELLESLEASGRPWGIVTNKLARYTEPLIAALKLAERAACVVSGDTCARAKPFPDPLLEAARRIGLPASACMYVGDDERDVQAASAAGMHCLVAGYGYLGDGPPPEQWGGRAIITHPLEVLNFV